MKKYIISIILLFFSCTSINHKIISIKKNKFSLIVEGDRVAIVPPKINDSYNQKYHVTLNRIGKIILPKHIKNTPYFKINNYNKNNLKFILAKTSKQVGANIVIHPTIQYSTMTKYPEKKQFKDHTKIQNQDQNQIQYGTILYININYSIFNSKNFKKLKEKKYFYKFYSLPYNNISKKNTWIKKNIQQTLRISFKKYLKNLSTQKIEVKRYIF